MKHKNTKKNTTLVSRMKIYFLERRREALFFLLVRFFDATYKGKVDHFAPRDHSSQFQAGFLPDFFALLYNSQQSLACFLLLNGIFVNG